MSRVAIRGRFGMSYLGPGGRPGWDAAFRNGVTLGGVNYLLNAGFRGGFASGAWYLGLISDAGFSALAEADTYDAHPGWRDYPYWVTAVPFRPQWTVGPASGGVVASTTVSAGTVNFGGSVRGAYLTTKNDIYPGVATTVLWATGAMAAGRLVAAGGTLSLTYTIRLTAR